jgi:hypothetical protein
VHFSLEALPPWLHDQERPGIFDYFVLVDVSATELANAAETWIHDLAEYPER